MTIICKNKGIELTLKEFIKDGAKWIIDNSLFYKGCIIAVDDNIVIITGKHKHQIEAVFIRNNGTLIFDQKVENE